MIRDAGLTRKPIRAMTVAGETVEHDSRAEVGRIFLHRPGAVVSRGEHVGDDVGTGAGTHALVRVDPNPGHATNSLSRSAVVDDKVPRFGSRPL